MNTAYLETVDVAVHSVRNWYAGRDGFVWVARSDGPGNKGRAIPGQNDGTPDCSMAIQLHRRSIVSANTDGTLNALATAGHE